MSDDAATGDVDPTSLDLRSRASTSLSGGASDASLITGPRSPDSVPIAWLKASLAVEGLDRLRRAGITAYLEHGADPPDEPGSDEPSGDAVGTIYAPSADREDALTVLATLGEGVVPVDSEQHGSVPQREAGAAEQSPEQIDEAFAALIADIDLSQAPQRSGIAGASLADYLEPAPSLDFPDAAPLARAATDDELSAPAPVGDDISRRLAEEADEDPPELREEHFVPPSPPPVPRPTAAAAFALLLIAIGIGVLIFGSSLGIAPGHTMTTGILIILAGGGLLGARIKRYRDETDDGAVL